MILSVRPCVVKMVIALNLDKYILLKSQSRERFMMSSLNIYPSNLSILNNIRP